MTIVPSTPRSFENKVKELERAEIRAELGSLLKV
jgi:hypothetical protein